MHKSFIFRNQTFGIFTGISGFDVGSSDLPRLLIDDDDPDPGDLGKMLLMFSISS